LGGFRYPSIQVRGDATMICRRFRPEDKAAVISILRESIDDWDGEWAEAYWEWKFERNPHGPGRIWVGDDGGRIAGCYIWNPVRVRLGDTTLLGAQSVDAAVHPDYRGHGLFTELARTAMEDDATGELAIVYAFPVEAAFRGQVRVGFKPRLTVSAVHRPLLSGLVRRRRFDGLTLGESTSFDSRFDAFSNSGRNSELTVQRDADYLQWRYCAHPAREYETSSASGTESSAATACCSWTPPRGSLVGGSSIFRCCRTPNRRPSSSCTTPSGGCGREARGWRFPGYGPPGRSRKGLRRSASPPVTSRSSAD
jgi:GNAT superfamily N-acetyltransferase